MSDDWNKFAPPSSPLELPAQPREREIASKGRRFGTLVVDYICYLALAFVFGVLIALLFGSRGLAALHSVPDLVTGSVLYIGYYAFFEGIWARTPGKLIFGTVAVDEQGGNPSFKKVLIRTVCRFIPFEPFSALGKQPWHDLLSDTDVVRYHKR